MPIFEYMYSLNTEENINIQTEAVELTKHTKFALITPHIIEWMFLQKPMKIIYDENRYF